MPLNDKKIKLPEKYKNPNSYMPNNITVTTYTQHKLTELK